MNERTFWNVDVLRFYWAHKMCSKEVSLGWNERRLDTAGNEFVKASLVFGSIQHNIERKISFPKNFFLPVEWEVHSRSFALHFRKTWRRWWWRRRRNSKDILTNVFLRFYIMIRTSRANKRFTERISLLEVLKRFTTYSRIVVLPLALISFTGISSYMFNCLI